MTNEEVSIEEFIFSTLAEMRAAKAEIAEQRATDPDPSVRLAYARDDLERRLSAAGCQETVTLYHGYARLDGFFEARALRIIADAIDQACAVMNGHAAGNGA